MRLIDLTIPLGIATPPWPTYEPLQVKYFKRLAPNGANGQVLTHSNHLGTHLDGEIHFHTAGNPGRHDLDDAQELNYRGICAAIAETGYEYYVGHEFSPKADGLDALKAAFAICDQ